MRRKLMLTSLVAVIALGFFGALTNGIEVDKEVFEEYVCPPCGCGNDDKVHDKDCGPSPSAYSRRRASGT